jgi:hypothetical protein
VARRSTGDASRTGTDYPKRVVSGDSSMATAQARVSECAIAYPDFPAPIGTTDSAYRLPVLGGAPMHS